MYYDKKKVYINNFHIKFYFLHDYKGKRTVLTWKQDSENKDIVECFAGEWRVFTIQIIGKESQLNSMIPSMNPFQGKFETLKLAKKRAHSIFVRWTLASGLLS